MPVNAAPLDRTRSLEDIPLTDPLIVYCQSAKCPFADRVVRYLRASGYENVMVYREGYKEWQRAGTVAQELPSRDGLNK
jgi:rhodanese-related sulfurtransferase